jgi:hypothetical protein
MRQSWVHEENYGIRDGGPAFDFAGMQHGGRPARETLSSRRTDPLKPKVDLNGPPTVIQSARRGDVSIE